ncbi:MAG: ArnT family glycosyltransferase [Xanthobacteraceae bacterium]
MQMKPSRQVVPASKYDPYKYDPYKYDPYDIATFLLLGALTVLALLTVKDYGISNDEEVQHRYGELIIAYYTSGFTDLALLKYDNLYLYGGLFDVLAILVSRVLPFDPYVVRHVLCALCGIGGIAAAWATARLVAGPRAGLIAAVALAVTGVWYGGMFNHTKDITFAAALMGGTYALMRAARDLPRPRQRDVLLFGLMLGCALGLRAMGILLAGYLGVIVLMKLFDGGVTTSRDRLAFLGRCALVFSPALLFAYLIMLAFWPYAQMGLFNPLRALFQFANFHYEIRDLLAGKMYLMNEMPRWYLPAYLSIKLPLFMLGGALVAMGLALTPRRQSPPVRYEIAFLAFVVLFPVLLQVILHSPIFSGMRHFLFVVPPLAALAGIGWHLAISEFERWRKPAAMAAIAVLAALIVWNASILFRLHPHQYVYYNALVGGLKGANGRYATDYWVNSMPEAVRGLEAFLARTEKGNRHYLVAICAERLQFDKVASERLEMTETWDTAEFFISPTHMNCDRVLKGDVVVTVERLGVVLAVVKDRRAFLAANPPKKKR